MTSQEILSRLLAEGYKNCFLDRVNPSYTIILNRRGEIDSVDGVNGPWQVCDRLDPAYVEPTDNMDQLFADIEATWSKEEPK